MNIGKITVEFCILYRLPVGRNKMALENNYSSVNGPNIWMN